MTSSSDVAEAVADQLAADPSVAAAFVGHGPPAWDCYDVGSVHLVSVVPVSDQRAARCATKLRWQYQATVVRCWPTLADDGTPPEWNALTAASVRLADDDGLLRWSISQGIQTLALACSDWQATVGNLVGPQGGMAARTVDFWVEGLTVHTPPAA